MAWLGSFGYQNSCFLSISSNHQCWLRDWELLNYVIGYRGSFYIILFQICDAIKLNELLLLLWLTSSGIIAGRQGAECPQTLLTGKFLLTYQKKRGKEKKGKMEKKEQKSKNERWKIENGRKKSYKFRRGPLFYLFIYLFIYLLWVYQNGNFLPGKSISRRENDFAPSEKYFSYAPV